MATFTIPRETRASEAVKQSQQFFRDIRNQRITGNAGAAEKISRTGLPDDVLQRLSALRPPITDDGDSDFRFGKASQFRLADEKEPPTNPVVTTTIINTRPDDDQGVFVIDYQEIDYTYEDVRVENPDDSEQYVIEERKLISLYQRVDQPDTYLRLHHIYKAR